MKSSNVLLSVLIAFLIGLNHCHAKAAGGDDDLEQLRKNPNTSLTTYLNSDQLIPSSAADRDREAFEANKKYQLDYVHGTVVEGKKVCCERDEPANEIRVTSLGTDKKLNAKIPKNVVSTLEVTALRIAANCALLMPLVVWRCRHRLWRWP